MFALSGCQFIGESFKPKPVNIDGLGSLQSLQDRELNRKNLSKLLKATSQLKRVNQTDAQAMLNIFKKNISHFFDASQNAVTDNTNAESQDVEYYLELIMDYEQFKNPIEEIAWQESRRRLLQKIDFLNPKSNAGSVVGQFLSVYAKAFTQASGTNKNKETILEDKENVTNFQTKVLTLRVFEEKAYEKVNNSQSDKEEKNIAKQFIENIKIYNEAMPADEKILDTSGRLIDPNAPTINGGQRAALNSLALGSIDYENKPQAEEASRQVGNIVRPTANEIRYEVKTSYIPR